LELEELVGEFLSFAFFPRFQLADHCFASTPRRAAVYALNKWLNCSPIYVVNRDREESLAFIKAFKDSASETFNPELIHVETVEEAEKLDSPGELSSLYGRLKPKTEGTDSSRSSSIINSLHR
jgi:hypothetical protein